MTSKFPHEFVHVPGALIELAVADPRVHCNLRPDQRPRPNSQEERMRFRIASALEGFWTDPIAPFLRGLVVPCSLAIYFQGYDGAETGSAVIRLVQIFWTREGYPRLDFAHPHGMGFAYPCPNFWGGFILAVAVARDDAPVQFHKDKTGHVFVELLERWSSPVQQNAA